MYFMLRILFFHNFEAHMMQFCKKRIYAAVNFHFVIAYVAYLSQICPDFPRGLPLCPDQLWWQLTSAT